MWTRPLGTNSFVRGPPPADETTELAHQNLMAQFSCVTQNPHYTTVYAGRLPGGELRSSAGKTDRTGYLFVALVIFINVMPRVLACPHAVFVFFVFFFLSCYLTTKRRLEDLATTVAPRIVRFWSNFPLPLSPFFQVTSCLLSAIIHNDDEM